MSPVKYTDANGRVIEGGTTHIYGGCCFGTLTLFVLAIFGAIYLLQTVIGLVLA